MSYFKAKCTQFDFGWGCAPPNPSWISGGLLLRGRRGVEGEEKCLRREVGKGRGRKGVMVEKGRAEGRHSLARPLA